MISLLAALTIERNGRPKHSPEYRIITYFINEVKILPKSEFEVSMEIFTEEFSKQFRYFLNNYPNCLDSPDFPREAFVLTFVTVLQVKMALLMLGSVHSTLTKMLARMGR